MQDRPNVILVGEQHMCYAEFFPSSWQTFVEFMYPQKLNRFFL